MDRCFPVARSADVVARHVAQSQLLDQEIAVWRADSGRVDVWENRCPHRGVRLSIGVNTGTELRCRYHGWRFASGSGQCTFIPAHPTQQPGSALHTRVYPSVERYGFVWTNLGGPSTAPLLPVRHESEALALRSLFVEAAPAAVAAALQRAYRATAADAYTLRAAAEPLMFLLQPVSATQTVIHGLLDEAVSAAERLAVLRRHNARLTALRADVERGA
jgi:nitrite reductase/ring-hydroxylating ferredoxin subunit